MNANARTPRSLVTRVSPCRRRRRAGDQSDANAEEQFGIPAPALELHEALRTRHGVLIASPEYNANVSPLLSNALAWTSRVQTHGAGTVHLAFQYSPLIALPRSLELQLGARVLPTMLSIANAHQAFDESGVLQGERNQHIAVRMADQLLTAVAPNR